MGRPLCRAEEDRRMEKKATTTASELQVSLLLKQSAKPRGIASHLGYSGLINPVAVSKTESVVQLL